MQWAIHIVISKILSSIFKIIIDIIEEEKTKVKTKEIMKDNDRVKSAKNINDMFNNL